MVLEIVAINMIMDGWEMKIWSMMILGVVIFVFDIGSDLLGFPT